VPDLPKVVIRDSAIDAICHGARLAAAGIIRSDPFSKGEPVALLSRKNEFVALGTGLVPSSGFLPGGTGLVVAPTAVFMKPGSYPKGWTKASEKIKQS